MEMILLSFVVGAVGMGVGGLLTALFGGRTDKMISIFLSFAAGVMVSIVLLKLVPEAIKYGGNDLQGAGIAIVGLAGGALLVLLLSNVLDKISGNRGKLHENYAEFFHSEDLIKRKKMLRAGTIMLLAMALHNIPEGLAIGAAGTANIEFGITMSMVIALHCIPEGMAVTAPLISGGLSKTKSVALTFMTGATTVVGAGIGVLIGGISDVALSLSLSIAGGAMLYVVFAEILPQTVVSTKNRIPPVFTLVGIITGILIAQI